MGGPRDETRALLPKTGAVAPVPRAREDSRAPRADVAALSSDASGPLARGDRRRRVVGVVAGAAAAALLLVAALIGLGAGAPVAAPRGAIAALGDQVDDYLRAHGLAVDGTGALGKPTGRRSRATTPPETPPAEGKDEAKKTSGHAPRNAGAADAKPPDETFDASAGSPGAASRDARRASADASAKTTSADPTEKKTTSARRPRSAAAEASASPSDSGSASDSSDPEGASSPPAAKKPRVLIAIMSWNGGGEELQAMQDTWLPELAPAGDALDMEVEYKVFVGREEETPESASGSARLGGAPLEDGSEDGSAFARAHGGAGSSARAAMGLRAGAAGDGRAEGDQGATFSVVPTIGSMIIPKDEKAEKEIKRLSDDLVRATEEFETVVEEVKRGEASSGSTTKDHTDADDALARDLETLDEESDEANMATLATEKNRKNFELVDRLAPLAAEARRAATEKRQLARMEREAAEKMAERERLKAEHMIVLDTGDAYEDLPSKVLGAIQWAVDRDYDYVFKADTDVFVIPDVFLRYLKVNAIDEGVDWMGTENKMYKLADGESPNSPENQSGFKCGLARDWHFGKCSRPELNRKPYSGVNPVSVDGGHGYLLSKDAMWAVTDYVFKHEEDELIPNKYVNIYEDQLVSHVLVKQGFLPVDFSGVAPFAVPGMTRDRADDACGVLEGALGAKVGERLRAMHDYRFESGANLYETGAGWNPTTMDARMLPTSLVRVGLQPYVGASAFRPKWEYYRDRAKIARQRRDGTYEPVTVTGVEFRPDMEALALDDDDAFEELLPECEGCAPAEAPGAAEEGELDRDGRSGAAGEKADDDEAKKKMTPGAMKNHGMKKGAKKKTSAYEEDEAEDEFDLEIAAEEAEAREREEAANRKGAITVEELDDDAYDPYPDPEWKGDKTDLAKAQVDALLRERSARRERGDNATDLEYEESEDEFGSLPKTLPVKIVGLMEDEEDSDGEDGAGGSEAEVDVTGADGGEGGAEESQDAAAAEEEEEEEEAYEQPPEPYSEEAYDEEAYVEPADEGADDSDSDSDSDDAIAGSKGRKHAAGKKEKASRSSKASRSRKASSKSKASSKASSAKTSPQKTSLSVDDAVARKVDAAAKASRSSGGGVSGGENPYGERHLETSLDKAMSMAFGGRTRDADDVTQER